VNWLCDKSLESGDFRTGDNATLELGLLSFDAFARDACAVRPTRSPLPTGNWAPTLPCNGPTPPPRASSIVLTQNATHYVVVDLSTLGQETYMGTNLMTHGSDVVDVDVTWSPRYLVPCAGVECNSNLANLWVCWGDECHAAGDYRISTSIQSLTDWDGGLTLTVSGAFGFNTAFDIRCDPTMPSDAVPVDEGTQLTWGDRVSLLTTSGITCPRLFAAPVVPSFIPTPTPTPAPTVDYDPIFHDALNRSVEVNLYGYPVVRRWVAVGSAFTYERDYFVFYPVDPKPPPSEFQNVLDGNGTVANVWRCAESSGGDFCASIGHSQYGLAWTLIGSDVDVGLNAVFGRGYGGYTVHMQFMCNESLPDSQVEFDDVGVIAIEQVLVLTARSTMVCPGYSNGQNVGVRRPPAGAVFLMILISGLVLYVSGGVIVNTVRKGAAFPNEDFWDGVRLSIAAAFACADSGDEKWSTKFYK
jgi:hypothetical protein